MTLSKYGNGLPDSFQPTTDGLRNEVHISTIPDNDSQLYRWYPLDDYNMRNYSPALASTTFEQQHILYTSAAVFIARTAVSQLAILNQSGVPSVSASYEASHPPFSSLPGVSMLVQKLPATYSPLSYRSIYNQQLFRPLGEYVNRAVADGRWFLEDVYEHDQYSVEGTKQAVPILHDVEPRIEKIFDDASNHYSQFFLGRMKIFTEWASYNGKKPGLKLSIRRAIKHATSLGVIDGFAYETDD